jgi:hypothetical protein
VRLSFTCLGAICPWHHKSPPLYRQNLLVVAVVAELVDAQR